MAKETLSWVKLSDPTLATLHPNGKALISLVNKLPKESKLRSFLFPVEELAKDEVTTKERFLSLCKYLDGTPAKVLSRLKRIENLASKPADPEPFIRYISDLYSERCNNTLLPFALDLKTKSTSLRASMYLGHKDLPYLSWAATNPLGRYLLDKFSRPIPPEDTTNDSDTRKSLAQYANKKLAPGDISSRFHPKKRIFMSALIAALKSSFDRKMTEHPDFLRLLDYSLSAYPSSVLIDSPAEVLERLQTAHLIDYLDDPNPGASKPLFSSQDQHQLFFFTDGKTLYHKIGVFNPPSLKNATKVLNIERIEPFKGTNLPTESDNEDTWYCMVDLLTLQPKVFNFKHFIPSGKPLPEKGGEYFTVATFAPDCRCKLAYTRAKRLKQYLPETLTTSTTESYVANPDTHPGSMFFFPNIPTTHNPFFATDFDYNKAIHHLPKHLDLSCVYCEQIGPQFSLLTVLTRLYKDARNYSSLSERYLHSSAFTYHRSVTPRYMRDGHLPSIPYNADIFCDLERCATASPEAVYTIPFFTHLLTGVNENHSPYHCYSSFYRYHRLEQHAVARSAICYDGSKGKLTAKSEALLKDKTDNSKPLFAFFVNDKAELSRLYDPEQLKLLDNYGPLAMTGSSVNVALAIESSTITRDAFASTIKNKVGAHTFVLTTPLARTTNTSTATTRGAFSVTDYHTYVEYPNEMTRSTIPSAMNGFAPVVEVTNQTVLPPVNVRVGVSSVNKRTIYNLPYNLVPESQQDLPVIASLEEARPFISVITLFISPLCISEGTIHPYASLNMLEFLHTWTDRLQKLIQDLHATEENLTDQASSELDMYAPTTVARRYRAYRKTSNNPATNN